jgi:hypothetical protein
MGVTMTTTSAEAWSTLDEMFASPTRARTVNIRNALATIKKGTTTMFEYFSKMKIGVLMLVVTYFTCLFTSLLILAHDYLLVIL